MSNVDEIRDELVRLNEQVADLRREIARTYLPRVDAARQRRRTAAVLLAVLVGLLATGYVTNRVTLARVDQTNMSLCGFFEDLAQAQGQLTPQSPELVVKFLVDSRNAFLGIGCPGRLPEPTKTVRDLAAKYRIELR